MANPVDYIMRVQTGHLIERYKLGFGAITIYPTAFVKQEPTLRSLRKGQIMATDVSSIAVQNCGTASHLSQSRHPLCIVLRKPFRDRRFFLLVVNCKIIVHNF